MADDPNKSVHAKGILWLQSEDPEMVAAIVEAQRTLGQYREELQREVRRAVPAVEDHGVKVFFPSPSNPRSGEHMWVNEVEFGDDVMRATLQNDAGWLPGLTEGAQVTFTADRVSDWFFVVGGVVQGGFTIKLILGRLKPEEFALYRDGSPACYFAEWYTGQQSNPRSTA